MHVLLVSILASSELTTGPDVGLSPSPLLCIPPVSGGQLWFTPPYILVRSQPLTAMLLVLLLTGLADSFPSQTQSQDHDYVDINEGALVKVEFSKTLRDGLKMFVRIISLIIILC